MTSDITDVENLVTTIKALSEDQPVLFTAVARVVQELARDDEDLALAFAAMVRANFPAPIDGVAFVIRFAALFAATVTHLPSRDEALADLQAGLAETFNAALDGRAPSRIN